jgi:hypothetical protein
MVFSSDNSRYCPRLLLNTVVNVRLKGDLFRADGLSGKVHPEKIRGCTQDRAAKGALAGYPALGAGNPGTFNLAQPLLRSKRF